MYIVQGTALLLFIVKNWTLYATKHLFVQMYWKHKCQILPWWATQTNQHFWKCLMCLKIYFSDFLYFYAVFIAHSAKKQAYFTSVYPLDRALTQTQVDSLPHGSRVEINH